jgi:serine/threonine protein kinase
MDRGTESPAREHGALETTVTEAVKFLRSHAGLWRAVGGRHREVLDLARVTSLHEHAAGQLSASVGSTERWTERAVALARAMRMRDGPSSPRALLWEVLALWAAQWASADKAVAVLKLELAPQHVQAELVLHFVRSGLSWGLIAGLHMLLPVVQLWNAAAMLPLSDEETAAALASWMTCFDASLARTTPEAITYAHGLKQLWFAAQRQTVQAALSAPRSQSTLLGHGCSGSVWRVRLHDGCEYAVKSLHSFQGIAAAELNTFLFNACKEYAALTLNAHPSVVACFFGFINESATVPSGHDVWSSTTLDLVLELFDTTLQGSIGERSLVSKVPMLLAELLAGLQHLHAAGFIHRDIKPANILLKLGVARDRFVLGDLGELMGEGEAESLNLSTCTPSYMPPEMDANGQRGDIRVDLRTADVWGLAVTVYHLLEGKQLDDRVCAFEKHRAVLPRRVLECLTHMSATDPHHRISCLNALKMLHHDQGELVELQLSLFAHPRCEAAQMLALLLKEKQSVGALSAAGWLNAVLRFLHWGIEFNNSQLSEICRSLLLIWDTHDALRSKVLMAMEHIGQRNATLLWKEGVLDTLARSAAVLQATGTEHSVCRLFCLALALDGASSCHTLLTLLEHLIKEKSLDAARTVLDLKDALRQLTAMELGVLKLLVKVSPSQHPRLEQCFQGASFPDVISKLVFHVHCERCNAASRDPIQSGSLWVRCSNCLGEEVELREDPTCW